ncbi:MAG TPA: hypothetical protein DCE14_02010 [Kosmotogaceae bacterium]|nr:MAG: Uncharacterized protein XE05_1341 [Thermotogales bacterium 46_20]HAA85108.1 hypothetical protein [Kosmotogaceae bacterium]
MTPVRALGRSLDWENGPVRLTVREIFHNVVNLENQEGLRYSFISDPSSYQPRSALVVSLPPTCQGESLVIDLSETPPEFSPFLPSCKPLKKWIPVVEDWIQYLIDNDLNLALSYIENESLASLIGLGPGKTPSGDDLLAGYITGLHWLDAGEACRVCGDVLPHISLTDWFSQNMIADACQAKVSKVVLDLCHALSLSHSSELYTSVRKIASTGHTSGESWLAGFGFALFSHFFREGRYDEVYEGNSR